MPTLDLDFVRQQFPAFAEPSLQGTAFFENAGGSYMCKQVMGRFETYFRQLKLQPYYPNSASSKAGDWMDEGYSALAPWLNVSADDIYFGPSTSQNTYVLANAVHRWLQPGDEIIVTNQDHEANSGVWRRLADRGVIVREWQVNPENGKLDVKALENIFTSKSKLLVFPHCSNILGEINPVAEICRLARAYGIRTIVDGVSFAGHGLPDFKKLGADIYLFSLYKVYGPHQGVMVIGRDMAELLGNEGHFFNADIREKRLMPAGPDHAQIAATKGVADYFESLYVHHFGLKGMTSPEQKATAVRSLLHDAEASLLAPLIEYLNQHPSVRVIGPEGTEGRAPTVSITVQGYEPLQLAEKLGLEGFFCGAGHFYSYRLLKALNIDPSLGVLRFSMVHYTSANDVAQLIDALDRLI
ncbi:aminotransferase class V-fold PLP-dependent enzyme [Kordiimonas pumila]|uniref:Aminotransferase class V-fold PLP-dependent enzyme n=1 Tax=Kordiimonas pumila TaxID=2161677 RepID=A0ABV7D8K3_9PROT|nr:aminotransferase class V-fold PLP-dependent enzyme [Kordiimonas pumila]